MYLNRKALVSDISAKLESINKSKGARSTTAAAYSLLMAVEKLKRNPLSPDNCKTFQKGGRIDLGNGITANHRIIDAATNKLVSANKSGSELEIAKMLNLYTKTAANDLHFATMIAVRKKIKELAAPHRKKDSTIGRIGRIITGVVGLAVIAAVTLAVSALTLMLLLKRGVIQMTRTLQIVTKILEGADVAVAALILLCTLISISLAFIAIHNNEKLKHYDALEKTLNAGRLEKFEQYRNSILSQSRFDGVSGLGVDFLDVGASSLFLAAQVGEFVLALRGSPPIIVLGINLFSFLVMAGLLCYVVQKSVGSFLSAKGASYAVGMPKSRKCLLVLLVMTGIVAATISIISMSLSIAAIFSSSLQIPFGVSIGLKVATLAALLLYGFLILISAVWRPKEQLEDKVDRLLDQTSEGTWGDLALDSKGERNAYICSKVEKFLDMEASNHASSDIALLSHNATSKILFDNNTQNITLINSLISNLKSKDSDGKEIDFDVQQNLSNDVAIKNIATYNMTLLKQALRGDDYTGIGIGNGDELNIPFISKTQLSNGQYMAISLSNHEAVITNICAYITRLSNRCESYMRSGKISLDMNAHEIEEVIGDLISSNNTGRGESLYSILAGLSVKVVNNENASLNEFTNAPYLMNATGKLCDNLNETDRQAASAFMNEVILLMNSQVITPTIVNALTNEKLKTDVVAARDSNAVRDLAKADNKSIDNHKLLLQGIQNKSDATYDGLMADIKIDDIFPAASVAGKAGVDQKPLIKSLCRSTTMLRSSALLQDDNHVSSDGGSRLNDCTKLSTIDLQDGKLVVPIFAGLSADNKTIDGKTEYGMVIDVKDIQSNTPCTLCKNVTGNTKGTILDGGTATDVNLALATA